MLAVCELVCSCIYPLVRRELVRSYKPIKAKLEEGGEDQNQKNKQRKGGDEELSVSLCVSLNKKD